MKNLFSQENSPTPVREAILETDASAITEIIIQSNHEQTNEEDVRQWVQYASPGRVARHLVCVNEQKAVIGYGHCIHPGSSPDNHFDAWVGVNLPQRCQGVGTALWNAILEALQGLGAAQVMCEVLEKEPHGLTFAQKRGFAIERHKYHSTLDLSTFDETPFMPVIARLKAGGICFCTLADLPDNPETQRKYYEINLLTVRDIPGEYWNFDPYPQFFKEQITGAAWFRREGQILAVDGDAFAGFASVSLARESQSAYNATTGVRREYRGRNIGLALKVLAARYARQSGARQIVTDNDSLNAPVLAINRKLGYQPEPGKYVLVRQMRNS
jgi:GNAT superfamily N-acetyltransferase